ncbi:signal transduction histidine kinase [Propionibacteriaceae bacterium ES.041]|uniref:histidine kinase n=1 Tax=Enemella evansiae TaxID=2016499 RepID=A0A255GS78_9ACTN|nr:sensor histidine kinase [Enemella evansiae]PFG69185.1 signal transduction histidine kinase [Propionibacteriaceae bacterium ES.041]OYO12084.1 sensor histidine kinase [Enemella evansiae]OYO14092.1 sensor histidine kinase [Enemella evansiae]OYO17466.1 sensor histidine kinase [Enemella evansiae]TDO89470.1 signal transduction histidine kinase [Enemella evansiae]
MSMLRRATTLTPDGELTDHPRGWIGDLALTGFLLLTTVFPYFLVLTYGYWGFSGWGQILVGLTMVTPLALRSHFPMLMLGLVSVGGVFHLLLSDTPLPCLIVIPLVVYSVARWVDARESRIALVIGGAASALGPMSWYKADTGWDVNVAVLAVLVCLGMVLTPYVVGRRLRESERAKLQQANAEAERIQNLLAERDQRARMAEISARQQIARELHDIVAHSVSVMVVQAEGGRAMAAKKPEKAAEVLDTIASTGREALTEMRRIVGVLRSGSDEGEAYAPMPGMGDIPEMVQRMGDRVELRVEGTPPPCGAATQLTVYRVVQEALTNFLKHAGPQARALVTLRYSGESIIAEVVDDGIGQGSASDGMGNGLKGMAERVGAMGGVLEVGPRSAGGFGVRALVPVLPTGSIRTQPQPGMPARG